MPNPLKALTDYLTGADLRREDEQKALTISGFQSYTQVQHLLVHGPGASEQQEWTNDANSAVFACLIAVSDSYIEPPVKVWRRTEPGQQEWLDKHPLQDLLDNPHPVLAAEELWWWTQYARACDGNAYLRKIRAGNETTGNVVELRPISPATLHPMTDRDSPNFIDFYRWNYAPGKFEDIDPVNIIHFRFGVDDRDMRLGLSPLKRLVREISTDAQATAFSDTLLRNFAVPGLVIKVPADAARMSRDDAEDISDRVAARFSGEGRGRVGVLAGGADIAPVGFSPEQLQLDVLHGFPESRIAAAIGVPPAIAGLQIGLEQTANYASMRQLRENFTEVKLIPAWRMDDARLNKHLLPDFDSSEDVFVGRDLTDVRSLQEDENAKYARLDMAVKTGWIKPNEARADVGLPTDPEMDVKPALAPQALPPSQQDQVPPDQLPAAAMRAIIDMKARGDFADYPELMDAMIELAMPALESEIAGYLDGQRLRVKRRILGA